jgi:HEAT repeat protein
MKRFPCLIALVGLEFYAPWVLAQVPDHTGQVPSPQPLGGLVKDSVAIAVLEVVKVDRGTDQKPGLITFKKIADLKGKHPENELRHSLLGSADHAALCDWAKPGRQAVFFSLGARKAVTCVGNHWNYNWDFGEREGLWSTASWVDGFRHTCVGSVAKLREAVSDILAGKEVVITATNPIGEELFDAEETPIVRDWLHGKKGRVFRIKASLELADQSALEHCPGGYVVGPGVGGKEVVPQLIAALKSDDALVRSDAAENLGQFGPIATAALPALLTTLADEDDFVRVFAAEAMARIDPRNKQVWPVLLHALESKQRGVRSAAITALATLRRADAGSVAALLGILADDSDAALRALTAFALGRLALEADETFPRRDVVKGLGHALRKDRTEDVRKWAARALLKFSQDARPVLSDLRAALKDRSDDAAAVAQEVLARLGDDGRAALAASLGEKDCPLRALIVERLEDLGQHSKAIVPALEKALNDEDASVRYAAARALLRIDHPTGVRLGVPVLARLAADKNYEYREYVIESLGELGPEARESVPTLIEIVKSPEKTKYRRRAVDALGQIGPAASSAVPALIAVLSNDKDRVQDHAVIALGMIGPAARDALPPLRARLTQPKGSGKILLAVAVAKIGDQQKAAEALLEVARAHRKRIPHESALIALGNIGPDAASALPALKKLLRDEDGWSDRWAAFAICRIGRPVKMGDRIVDERQEGFEALTALIHEPDRRYGRFGVTEVVQQLGPDAKPLVPAFVAVLKDKKSRERLAVLQSLSAIGPAAAEAVPTLEAMLKEDPEATPVAVTLARLGQPRPSAAAVKRLVEEGKADLAQGFFSPSAFRDLEALGAEARPAVPFLLRVMRHDNHILYLRAARLLHTIDPQIAQSVGIYDAPPELGSQQTGVGERDDDD